MSVLGYIDLHVGRVFVCGEAGSKRFRFRVSGVSEASTMKYRQCVRKLAPRLSYTSKTWTYGLQNGPMDEILKAPREFEPQHSLVIFSPRVGRCDTYRFTTSAFNDLPVRYTSYRPSVTVSGPARYSSSLKQTG